MEPPKTCVIFNRLFGLAYPCPLLLLLWSLPCVVGHASPCRCWTSLASWRWWPGARAEACGWCRAAGGRRTSAFGSTAPAGDKLDRYSRGPFFCLRVHTTRAREVIFSFTQWSVKGARISHLCFRLRIIHVSCVRIGLVYTSGVCISVSFLHRLCI